MRGGAELQAAEAQRSIRRQGVMLASVTALTEIPYVELQILVHHCFHVEADRGHRADHPAQTNAHSTAQRRTAQQHVSGAAGKAAQRPIAFPVLPVR